MLRPFVIAAALALLAAPALAAPVLPYDVHERTLNNGLRVVVIPMDSPGVVALHTVVRTGSRDEVEPGHSGFAHFFEHMMFRGTERFSTDAYNDVLKRMGADSNAYTTDDFTNYFIVGPAAQLETMMDVESDRFQHLSYDEPAFRTEALAVLGEYNKNASNPLQGQYERLRELSFDVHTYKHTTMGFLADIKAMPGYYEYSRAFFQRFYRPENAVVLVVGDAQPDAVFALAERLWGPWQRGYQAADVKPEPVRSEQRRDHLEWPSPTQPIALIGYRAPAFTADGVETAALGVIDQLLFSESAPLWQELVVEKQWVDTLDAWPARSRDPGLLIIHAQVRSDDRMMDVLRAIDAGVKALRDAPVDAARLERVKSHLRYDFAGDLDSPAAVAQTVSSFIGRGGSVGAIEGLYARYAALTPADVQRVAREVLVDTNRTIVTLSGSAPAGKGE